MTNGMPSVAADRSSRASSSCWSIRAWSPWTFGPLEAFATANAVAHRPLYRLAIAGMTWRRSRPLGIHITPSVRRRPWGPIDTLLVSGGYGQAEASCDQDLLAWLKTGRRRARGCGIDLHRAFVLAAAGLLDGKRATTHWAMAEELGRRYPEVAVEVDRIFGRDGSGNTSAGVTPASTWRSAYRGGSRASLALGVARSLVVDLSGPAASRVQQPSARPVRGQPPVGWSRNGRWKPRGRPQRQALGMRADMSERTFRRAFADEAARRARLCRTDPHRCRARPVRGGPVDGAVRGDALGFETVQICAAPSCAARASRRTIPPALPPGRRGARARRRGGMTELAGDAASSAGSVVTRPTAG